MMSHVTWHLTESPPNSFLLRQPTPSSNPGRGRVRGRCRVQLLLKNFGPSSAFKLRAGDLLEGRPELAAAVEPLLAAREAVGCQIVELDGKVRRLAKASEPVRRLMTAPGVGPITAL
jgi:transposase